MILVLVALMGTTTTTAKEIEGPLTDREAQAVLGLCFQIVETSRAVFETWYALLETEAEARIEEARDIAAFEREEKRLLYKLRKQEREIAARNLRSRRSR